MGACTFYDGARGVSARDAFDTAVSNAKYNHGHAGYTGTIAEKHSFVMIDLPEGEDPEEYADQLLDDGDSRIDDKWGPAGCIKTGENRYFFFGWASE
jgi:hypothetical protein